MDLPNDANNIFAEVQDQVFVLTPNHKLIRSEVSNGYRIEDLDGKYELSMFAGEFLSRCNGEHNVSQIFEELSVRFYLPNFQIDAIAFIREALRMNWITEVSK